MRHDPPDAGSERQLLQAFLTYNRETVLLKLAGLSKEQAVQKVVPSLTTLLGMVKHLTDAEAWWFQGCLDGQEFNSIWSETDPDAAFRILPDESIDDIVERIARSARCRMRSPRDTILRPSRHILDSSKLSDGSTST